MIFRQFCAADSYVSYLLADPVTRYGVLIDPRPASMAQYQDAVQQLDVRVLYLLQTHAPALHANAAEELATEFGARLVAYPEAGRGLFDVAVVDGNRLYMGEEMINVMATMGDGASALCFQWRDRVFTGCELLAGTSGEPDAAAIHTYTRLAKSLFAFPDEMLVYPGHLTGNRRVSSIGD